jgi:HSP20 family protein
MSIWDRYGEMARLRDELSRIGLGPRGRPGTPDELPWAPQVDIHEREDALVLVMDLPGVRREDMELQVEADGLILQGWRSRVKGTRDLRLERPAGPFRRAFRIGVPIEPAKARASYRDGVLEITIPKAAAGGPGRVRVEVG